MCLPNWVVASDLLGPGHETGLGPRPVCRDDLLTLTRLAEFSQARPVVRLLCAGMTSSHQDQLL